MVDLNKNIQKLVTALKPMVIILTATKQTSFAIIQENILKQKIY